MYIIVTTDEKLAKEALKKGASVFEDLSIGYQMGKFAVVEDEEVERRIVDILDLFAFKQNTKGYNYIKYILKRCFEDENYYKKDLVDVIYPECAKKFNTTGLRVEQSMVRAIDLSFNTVPEIYSQLLNYRAKKGPKNLLFLYLMAEYIKSVKNAN